jgi:hypothetical protein
MDFNEGSTMRLILSPKDTVGKIILESVSSFALEGGTLMVVFESGRIRNYPLLHLWYYESHAQYHKKQPLVASKKLNTKAFKCEQLNED